jgi:signal transduction histidine kinase
VTQEALNNVAKHAAARAVRIVLASGPRGTLRLSVADDGVGLSEAQIRRPDAFGLAGMRERVRAVGGTLRLRGREGRGTTVEVEIPAA